MTACGVKGRSASAASRFDSHIASVAASSAPAGATPSRTRLEDEPGAERLGEEDDVARLAVLFRQTQSGCTVPTTASPYFGSSSRIVWPPARIAPASRTASAAPARISPSISTGSSSGKAVTESASSGRPPIAKTSLSALVAAIRPKVARVVDDGREEVDGEDERRRLVELVDGRVVGRVETDQQVVRLGRHEAVEQLLEPGRRILGRAPTCLREAREAFGPAHPARVYGRPPGGL